MTGFTRSGHLLLNYGRRKQEANHDLVDKRHEAVVGQWVFVNSARLTGIRMTVQRVRNIFSKSSRPWFLSSQLLAGGGLLRVDFEIFESRLDDDGGWRLL